MIFRLVVFQIMKRNYLNYWPSNKKIYRNINRQDKIRKQNGWINIKSQNRNSNNLKIRIFLKKCI